MRFTENEKGAWKVMGFLILTELKVTPFEPSHGKRPRAEAANRVKINKI